MNREGYTYKYPHPAVTADNVVFGYDGSSLYVLLIERGKEPYKGCWALPGGFVGMDETVEEGALRELTEETHVHDIYLEQFHVFSAVDRDPRERVVSVAFWALVRKTDYEVIGGDDAVRAEWFDMKALPRLAFDHEEMILMARMKLQEAFGTKPVAFRLLDSKFSMNELQNLFEVVNDVRYDRDGFRKKMLATGYLKKVEVCPESVRCGVSQLYSFDEELFDADRKNGTLHRFPWVV